jgi:hypothetical protein
MPALIPPVPISQAFDDVAWSQFFELVRKMINQPVFYSQATDPGTAGVPNGTWSIWKNTTTSVVKLWVNDGGVMKSVTIS